MPAAPLVVFTSRPNSHPFQERHISCQDPIKIGRSVARYHPAPTNAIFDCKVLSRNHALLWFEDNKVGDIMCHTDKLLIVHIPCTDLYWSPNMWLAVWNQNALRYQAVSEAFDSCCSILCLCQHRTLHCYLIIICLINVNCCLLFANGSCWIHVWSSILCRATHSL